MNLEKTETRLIGKWNFIGGSIKSDDTVKRIKWLLENQLKRLASDSSGWDDLYINPNDNRLWELVYLESELQGGGPPSLINILKEEALKKYKVVINDFD
jgi:hypothetical protein